MTVFPTEDMELTRLLVVSDVGRSREWYERVLGTTVDHVYEVRAFFGDPDGRLFEISELTG